MASVPFGLPRRPATGVGFGDWFQEHQAAQAQQQGTANGGNAAANGSGNGSVMGTGWNKYMPAWAERTDGQSLLPTFLTGEQQQRNETADSMILGMSYSQRFKGFVVTLLLSVAFFLLAFFVGLPVVVIRPHKFALCFTLGSMSFMGSFAMLRGPSEQCRQMFKQDRLPFTAVYVISMLGTLYACLVLKSYFMVIGFSGIQALALVWYFCSMVPGGSRGMQYFMSGIAKTARYTVMPCIQGTKMFVGSIIGR